MISIHQFQDIIDRQHQHHQHQHDRRTTALTQQITGKRQLDNQTTIREQQKNATFSANDMSTTDNEDKTAKLVQCPNIQSVVHHRNRGSAKKCGEEKRSRKETLIERDCSGA
jgi:hypothetical protein